jgi:hypothetical protein
MWLAPDGARHHAKLCAAADVLSKIDALREELRDARLVANGLVPRLRLFMDDWGRRLLPEALLTEPPDVLVIVPHAYLHDLPLHLVKCGPAGEPLGALSGMTYSSSMSLFARCASRNPARQADLSSWTFDERGASPPQNAPRPRSLIGVGADVLGGKHEEFCRVAKDAARLLPGDKAIFCADESGVAGRQAVKAAFRRDMPPDVLILTAHGFVDVEEHRLSGLLLQQWRHIGMRPILRPQGIFEFRDLPLRRPPATPRTIYPAEVLTIAELLVSSEMKLAESGEMVSRSPLFSMVVLMACSAGWGRVLQGDEPASLAESFLHLGATSVVAPLWDSEYETSRLWIEHFFEAWLARGKPKALASLDATRQVRRRMGDDRPERSGVLTLRGDWL